MVNLRAGNVHHLAKSPSYTQTKGLAEGKL